VRDELFENSGAESLRKSDQFKKQISPWSAEAYQPDLRVSLDGRRSCGANSIARDAGKGRLRFARHSRQSELLPV